MGSKNKNKNKNKAEKPSAASAVEASGSGGSHHVHGRGSGKIISDPRFASLHSDPRFREAPKHKSKVAIDSRFNRMFTDRNFANSNARIDKRGKVKKDASENKLKHYYRLEEEEKKERNAKEELQKKNDVESEDEEKEKEESESEVSEESEKEEFKRKPLKKSSETESSESEEEEEKSDDDSSSSATDSEDDGDYSDEDDTDEQPEAENIPEIDQETHRLAVMNMDWSQVKAADLYVLLSSFLPKEGQIKSVTIYPSEFGLKRMEEEAVHGPVGLFDDDGENNGSDDDDDEEIDEKKIRAYELSRLRYYYAVVECDSTTTADYLYKNCDGLEFERSSVKLDLRFIPDSMEFKHQPRDVATEAPADYEGLDFQTRALQQSKIEITWDDDEPQRLRALKRKFNDDQLADLELQEFLASDESGTDDDDENDNDLEDRSAKKHKKEDMYRALLESGDGSDGSDDADGQDMEVTFMTGLEDISKRILEKKNKDSETVWEAVLRKSREKKKLRKSKSKLSSEDESSDDYEESAEEPDDFFMDESSVKGNKRVGEKAHKGKQKLEAAEEAASRAELELLLAEDKGADTSLKGYNLKPKKAKGKKGKEIPDESKIPTADYDDPRFTSLFNSPLFALDPTDPQFKRSAAYARQLAQKQQKGDAGNVAGNAPAEIPRQAHFSSGLEGGEQLSDERPLKNQKHELSSLVRSIKMKSIQVPASQIDNVPELGLLTAAKKRKKQSKH